jgi:hypothetical protein
LTVPAAAEEEEARRQERVIRVARVRAYRTDIAKVGGEWPRILSADARPFTDSNEVYDSRLVADILSCSDQLPAFDAFARCIATGNYATSISSQTRVWFPPPFQVVSGVRETPFRQNVEADLSALNKFGATPYSDVLSFLVQSVSPSKNEYEGRTSASVESDQADNLGAYCASRDCKGQSIPEYAH